MKIVRNDSLLKELSSRNIQIFSGSGKSMFKDVVEKHSYESLLKVIRELKSNDSKICLFLTDRKLGVTCFFDELEAVLLSYSCLVGGSRKKNFTTENMVLFAYKEDGIWNGTDEFWIAGKFDIPFTISGDLEHNEILDSNKARNVVKRASKLKSRQEIISFLDASLKS